MPTEADARIVIDRLLREAGWDPENKSEVSTEEASADGCADYLLKNSRTQPLAVVEAKRFSIDPYGAKQKAREYAESLSAPFVLLSNGRDHYFWDYSDGDARPVLGFPIQSDLERRANLRLHRSGNLEQDLLARPLPTRFRFKGEDVDARPYQLHCLEVADRALITGRRRMLFEMATGTGKTLTVAMLIKRWQRKNIGCSEFALKDEDHSCAWRLWELRRPQANSSVSPRVISFTADCLHVVARSA